jgi:hypothetical protein
MPSGLPGKGGDLVKGDRAAESLFSLDSPLDVGLGLVTRGLEFLDPLLERWIVEIRDVTFDRCTESP